MFVCVRICFCHLLLHVDSWCVCAKQVPLGGQLCGHQFIVFYGTVIYFRVSIHLIHVVQLQVSSCIYTSTLHILPSWLLHIVELTQKCRHYPIEYNMLGPPTHVSRPQSLHMHSIMQKQSVHLSGALHWSVVTQVSYDTVLSKVHTVATLRQQLRA